MNKNKVRAWSMLGLPGACLVLLLLLAAAWLHVQTVRLGYRVQAKRNEIDRLAKKDLLFEKKIESLLSLAHLNRLAQEKFNLKVPEASQIVILRDG